MNHIIHLFRLQLQYINICFILETQDMWWQIPNCNLIKIAQSPSASNML